MSKESLTSSQIVEGVLKYEPDKTADRGAIMATISAMLSARSKEGGEYSRVKNERDEYVYSLKR